MENMHKLLCLMYVLDRAIGLVWVEYLRMERGTHKNKIFFLPVRINLSIR